MHVKKSKTVLIDILHPAHVHFFKNVIHELEQNGYRTVITARDKEISIELLDAYDLSYNLLSKQKSGLGLFSEMIARTAKLIGICRKEKPLLMMGIMGPSIAVAGFLLRIPAWVFYDTENAWITNWFAYPLAKHIYTPDCYLDKKRKNETRYPGYHELAYLHPDLFAADKQIVLNNGIDPEERYIVVRFVSWQASHDAGEKGLAVEKKAELVGKLEQYAKVYITSEAELPDRLKDRQLKASVHDIHHIMAFARLVVGESATMASEAAMLGVKAAFISDTKRGYTLEQEELYGLVRNFSNSQFLEIADFIDEEFSDPNALNNTARSHEHMLAERINVTDYMLREIESRFGD